MVSVPGHRGNNTAGRGAAGELSAEQQAAIVARVLALPPMTDEQVDGVCEVIQVARTRWRAQDRDKPERDEQDQAA